MSRAPVVRERLRLRPGVFAGTRDNAEVTLVAWPHTESLGVLGPADRALLARLAAGPCDPDATGNPDGLLTRLRCGGWLEIDVLRDGRPWYRLEPRGRARPPDAGAAPVLSRFAVIGRSAAGPVIQSPLAWCDVRLHDPALLVAVMGADLPRTLPRLAADLRWAGLLATTEESAGDDLTRRQWARHDLWFHARSRSGTRIGDPVGATGRPDGRFPGPPARRPPTGDGATVRLECPDLDDRRRTEPGLADVMERRVSVRGHDDAAPITVIQLGEFLYRCARVRSTRDAEGDRLVDRPYPSAGARHELELYLVVRRVDGLAPGIYRYDGWAHRLEVAGRPGPHLGRLIADARAAAGMTAAPQLLLVAAARFGRTMGKYRDIGYALVLKNVGVLMQTMYLVATAMGLAPCAIGSGDSAAFAAATGLDPLAEGPVGEFILGSRASGTTRGIA
jgi:SagB-type dehydrogenase family enzyme